MARPRTQVLDGSVRTDNLMGASFLMATMFAVPIAVRILRLFCDVYAFIVELGTLLVGLVVFALTHPDTRSQPCALT